MRQGSQKPASIKTPETRAEFDALTLRRGELRDQLRALEQRRTEISAQRSVSDAANRGTLDQRIQLLDERVPRIERELLQLDEVIANSVGKMAAVDPTPYVAAPAPPPPPAWELQPGVPGIEVHPGPLSRFGPDVGRLMLFEAAGFLLIGFVAWRFALRRVEQRLMGKGSNPSDVVRLQQSVDSIALEVERISENQRYVTKLLGDKAPEVGAGEQRR